MKIIDTHTHIFAEQFKDDIDTVIKNAISEGVDKMVLPNIDVESVSAMLALSEKYSDLCFPAIGLHPTSVNENFENHLSTLYSYLEKNPEQFVGIGETGMDLYWDKTFLPQQIEALTTQINWAKTYQKPIILHVRNAFDEIFKVIDQHIDERLFGVFHCFTGNTKQARHILDYQNFKIGIGGVVTFKNSGLDKTVKDIPLEKIVVETDAPYLAPTPFRGKRNEPAYITKVIEKLSTIFELSQEEISHITTKNACELFNFSTQNN